MNNYYMVEDNSKDNSKDNSDGKLFVVAVTLDENHISGHNRSVPNDRNDEYSTPRTNDGSIAVSSFALPHTPVTNKKKPIKAGAIAGIVCGTLFGLCLPLSFAWVAWRKHKKLPIFKYEFKVNSNCFWYCASEASKNLKRDELNIQRDELIDICDRLISELKVSRARIEQFELLKNIKLTSKDFTSFVFDLHKLKPLLDIKSSSSSNLTVDDFLNKHATDLKTDSEDILHCFYGTDEGKNSRVVRFWKICGNRLTDHETGLLYGPGQLCRNVIFTDNSRLDDKLDDIKVDERIEFLKLDKIESIRDIDVKNWYSERDAFIDTLRDEAMVINEKLKTHSGIHDKLLEDNKRYFDQP